MSTQPTASRLLPEVIDLDALHAAYLAEGYEMTGDNGLTRGYAKQVKPLAGKQLLSIPLPAALADRSVDQVLVRTLIERAIDWLVSTTGNPHLEIGPRNDRERALIAALNIAHGGPVGDFCACGNRFDADNLCMPSACALEGTQ